MWNIFLSMHIKFIWSCCCFGRFYLLVFMGLIWGFFICCTRGNLQRGKCCMEIVIVSQATLLPNSQLGFSIKTRLNLRHRRCRCLSHTFYQIKIHSLSFLLCRVLGGFLRLNKDIEFRQMPLFIY